LTTTFEINRALIFNFTTNNYFAHMDNWKTTVEKILQTETNKVVKINLEKKSVEYTDKIKSHRDERVITGDEEIVKAFLLQRLVNQLDYKPELIEKEKEYPSGRPKTTKPRIDFILRDDKGKAFFFIEAKAPEKFEGDKWMIEGQLFALAALETKGVKYLVYYTAEYQEGNMLDKAIIIDFEKYKNYEDWDKAGRPSLSDKLSPGYDKPQKPPLKKDGSVNDLRTSINRDDINSLGSNLHNVLWGGGGTSDTEIFYSLVNIILAKIQDESETEDNEEYDFQVYSYGENIESPEKVFERITQLYKTALREKLNILDEKEISDARLIDRNKFPLNKLVYTVQSLEKYSFLEGRSSLDGRDILGDFFERITRDGFKQTKGQFFTPTPVVKFLFYALQIDRLSIDRLNKDRELPYIIDPSVGSGTFLVEAMKIITKEIKYKQRDKLNSSRQVKDRFDELFTPDNKENRWAKEYMYGSDINFDLGTASKVNMILHGDGSTNIFVKDGLLPFRFYDKDTAPNYLKIYQPDKLYKDKEVNAKFDVVVSNPPFSVNLENETKRYLNNSFLFGDKKNSENLFIERWYQV
jgi:type I restriction enzyme M protein